MARYWAKEERKAIASLERLDVESWFDLWHTHPDWNAKGNRCPENRGAVAEMTYRLLCLAERLFAKRSEPVQLFATLCTDTGNNAIYVHSPNPNGSVFPYPLDGVQWNLPVPLELAGLFNDQTHQIGWLGSESFGGQHVLRPRQDRAIPWLPQVAIVGR